MGMELWDGLSWVISSEGTVGRDDKETIYLGIRLICFSC